MAGTLNDQTNFNSRRAKQVFPAFGIKQITENGLIIHSQRPFELGATIALGMHFQLREKNEFMISDEVASSTTFLDTEGIVVESRPMVGSLVYEVTVVFAQLSPDQCAMLLAASNLRSDMESPRPPLSTGDPIGCSLSGFDRICSLN